MNSYKVYDSDVAGNDNLVGLAILFATTYRGNWEAMIAAKRFILDATELPTDQWCRTVLNMVLSDTSQSDQHDRILSHLRLLSENEIAARPVNFPRKPVQFGRPNLKVVRPSPRKVMVASKAKVHGIYGMSKSWNASLHVIDHSRTQCRWHAPHVNGQYDYDNKTGELFVYWHCGRHAVTGQRGLGAGLRLFKEIPEIGNLHQCKRCMEMARL